MYLSMPISDLLGRSALPIAILSEMAATDTKLAKVLLLTTERVLYSPRVFRGVLPRSTRPTLGFICPMAAH